MFMISLILLICLTCHWLAWRLQFPAIILFSVAGLLLGPVSGLLDPQTSFGELYPILVVLAAAFIVFDGGLSLSLKELKESKRAVQQIVVIGAPLGWLLHAALAHYLAGFSWQVAMVLGGILVVTGPTVIIPMLRQARLSSRVASVLKWEGNVNDGIGTLLALMAISYITFESMHLNPLVEYAEATLRIAAITLGNIGLGFMIGWLFTRGYVPEFLKNPTVLVAVMLAYSLSEAVQPQGGLLAVTIFGLTLTNINLPSIEDIRRFKENISVLMISLVFILITSTLQWQDFARLGWKEILFVPASMLVARPLMVWVSSIGTGLSWKEQLFIGWIGPRGIVVAAMSGLFGPMLVLAGYPEGAKLAPLGFVLVFTTVTLHGLTVRPLGRLLGLVAGQTTGVLIVGGNPFTLALAKELSSHKVNCCIVDNNWHHLSMARFAGLPNYYGEVLSEHAKYDIAFGHYNSLVAATDNPAYNALVCAAYAHEFGRDRLFQIGAGEQKQTDQKAIARHISGRLFGGGMSFEEVHDQLRQGAKIRSTNLTEDYNFDRFQTEHASHRWTPLIAITPSGQLQFFTGQKSELPAKNSRLIYLHGNPIAASPDKEP